MGIEFEILYMIQKLHNPILDDIMIAITRFGDGGLGWIVLGILLLCFKKTRKCGFLMLLSMGICLLVGNLALKNLVGRLRPCQVDAGVRMLISTPGGYSFPSGHTLHAFTAATAIFLHYKKPGIAALVLAALIAFSRMYLFVHYPTDILGGIILGVVVAVLVCRMAQKNFIWLYNRKKLC